MPPLDACASCCLLNATSKEYRFILSITSGNKILNELYELFFTKTQKKNNTKSAALYWPDGGCFIVGVVGDDFRSLPKNIEMKII